MTRSAPLKPDLLSSITNFGDLLCYLRQRARLTQRDLALAVGYSVSQISRLEHNQRLPDLMTISTHFFPALELQDAPDLAARLLNLAATQRGEAASEVGSSSSPLSEIQLHKVKSISALCYRTEKVFGNMKE